MECQLCNGTGKVEVRNGPDDLDVVLCPECQENDEYVPLGD